MSDPLPNTGVHIDDRHAEALLPSQSVHISGCVAVLTIDYMQALHGYRTRYRTRYRTIIQHRLMGYGIVWLIWGVRSNIIFQFAAVSGWVQTVRTLKFGTDHAIA
ncbi:hypothetical protein PBN151_4438 [Paenibacillus sp. NAIST15-1]|nr:hypothetical protein PBN151_4438 [Paenibacillus sp. NAIST15-1]